MHFAWIISIFSKESLWSRYVIFSFASGSVLALVFFCKFKFCYIASAFSTLSSRVLSVRCNAFVLQHIFFQHEMKQFSNQKDEYVNMMIHHYHPWILIEMSLFAACGYYNVMKLGVELKAPNQHITFFFKFVIQTNAVNLLFALGVILMYLYVKFQLHLKIHLKTESSGSRMEDSKISTRCK